MKLNANGTEISIIHDQLFENDYLSLTDLARRKNPYEPKDVVKNWLRLRSTIEFLGLWEKLYNTQFKGVEFDTFKNESGSNSFTLTPQRWIEKTNAIGMISKSGRGGGTYAHTDIAFEFASWISPEFKLYVILITPELTKKEQSYTYASEADILNIALFGKTAKCWREETGNTTKNIRDYANVEQLIVLVNLESMNAELIRQGLSASERLKKLRNIAYYQLKSLEKSNITEKLRKNIPQKEK